MSAISRTFGPMLARIVTMKSDRAFRQGIVLTVGRVVAIVLQIVTIRAFTTIIHPIEVGRYYLLLAAQTWATLLFLGAPSMYLWRNVLEWRKRDLHLRALGTFFGYTAAVALVTLPTFWIAVRLGFVSTTSAIATSVVLVSWLVAATSMNVLGMVLNLVQSRVASVLVTTGSSVLALTGALTFVFTTGSRTAEVWIAGLAAGTAIAAIAGMLWLMKVAGLRRLSETHGDESLSPSGSLVRSVWLFSWPIVIITGLFWMQSQGYRRILLTTAGESGVGQFAVAWSIGATIGIAVDQILQQWILPPFFHRVAERSVESIDELWQEYFAAVLRVIVPLAAFVAAVSPFLLRLLAGPTFQAHPMLPVWAAVAEMFHVVANFFYLGGVARRNTREMVLPHVLGAVCVLLAVYPASKWLGLHGAGAAVMLSYVVLAVAMWLRVRRRIFSRAIARDLARPAAFGLAIVVVCAMAGLAGWQASLPKAAITIVVAGLLFAGGALAALPRLLALTQPTVEVEAPIDASQIAEVSCL